MTRADRVGATIMLASVVPALVGLFLFASALEWAVAGYALVRQE